MADTDTTVSLVNRAASAPSPLSFREAVAAIAQGAINITEGLTTIEPNSRVHRGMTELCRLLNEGAVSKAELHSLEKLARSVRARKRE